MRVRAVPVTGKAKVEVFAGESCEHRLTKQTYLAPEVITFSDQDLQNVAFLCIQVSGDGRVSVVAASASLGPVLAPAVPAVGLLFRDDLDYMRLKVPEGADVMVTASAKDGSLWRISARII